MMMQINLQQNLLKEAPKQIATMHLLKPILKNLEEHPMPSDMEQVVTIDMEHDVVTMKNELVEDEPLAFEDQILETTDTLITGEEPAVYQLFYPLSLYQSKQNAVNKCQLQFDSKGKVLQYTGAGKPLHDKPTTVKVKRKGTKITSAA